MDMDISALKILGESLAIGLLVGTERYRARGEGEKRSAGVRTFAVFAVLGAVCGFLVEPLFTVATFAALAGLVLLGYHRSPAGSVGFTTEVAVILVFWIGYLLHIHETAAIALGIVLTIFLASKQALHGLVREQISQAEFYATIKFLAVVLVIYPVLPDRQMGPLDVLNPRDIWGLVILVSSISYVGYFLSRWLGDQRGLRVGAVLGSIISTPATTMSLAERARRLPGASRLFGMTAVMANAVQGPRLLILVWIMHQSLGKHLAIPLFGMGLAGFMCAWLMTDRSSSKLDFDHSYENPYSVIPALKFGAFFLVILLLTNVANTWFGSAGVYFASAIAGLGTASAVALSIAGLVGSGALDLDSAGYAMFLAIAVNTLTKWVLVLMNGTRKMALWLGAGLLISLVAGVLLLVFQPGQSA
jgi:uncharacterized membrane protein (DUF4010 family)